MRALLEGRVHRQRQVREGAEQVHAVGKGERAEPPDLGLDGLLPPVVRNGTTLTHASIMTHAEYPFKPTAIHARRRG